MGSHQDEFALEKRGTQNRLAQRRRRQRRAELEEERHCHDPLDTDRSQPSICMGRLTSASQSGARKDSVANSSSGKEADATKHVEPRQLDPGFQNDLLPPGHIYEDIFMDEELSMLLQFESRDAETSGEDSANIDPSLRTQDSLKSPISLQSAEMYRVLANIHVSAGAPEASMIFDTGLSLDSKCSEPIDAIKASDRSVKDERAAGKLTRRSQMILHFCAQRGDVKPVKLLLNHGAEISCSDHFGRTALHCAVKYLHQPVIRKLLAWVADTEVADCEGLTSLQLAVDAGAEAIVILLIEQGADLNAAVEY